MLLGIIMDPAVFLSNRCDDGMSTPPGPFNVVHKAQLQCNACFNKI